MLYGIVYVYRLSDFIEIARGHGVQRIFLNSLWLKENPVTQGVGCFKWTDLHELGFMGAFGMGFKMVVEGMTQESKMADNHLLWTQSGLVATHVKACSAGKGAVPGIQLLVTLGLLDSRQWGRPVVVPWSLFMEDRIPTEAAVHDVTH